MQIFSKWKKNISQVVPNFMSFAAMIPEGNQTNTDFNVWKTATQPK